MRTTLILVLALFAIASAKVQVHEVYESFGHKLGLKPQVYAELNQCTDAVRDFGFKVFSDFNLLTQHGNFYDKLAHFVTIGDAEHLKYFNKWSREAQSALVSCGKYLGTVASSVPVKREKGQEHLAAASVVERNALRYHAQIISIIAKIGDSCKAGDSKKVGTDLAEVVLILTGASRPAEVAKVDLSQVRRLPGQYPYYYLAEVVVDLVRDLTNEQTAQEVKHASDVLAVSFLQLKQLFLSLHNVHSPVEEAVLVLRALRIVAEEYSKVRVAFSPVATKLRQLRAHRSEAYLLRVAHNAAVNLPHIEHELEQAVVEISTNKSKQGAQRIADVIKMIHL